MPLLRVLRNILAMGHMRCRDIAKAMDMALSWVFEVINNRLLGGPDLKALWDETLELAGARIRSSAARGEE